MCDYISLNLIKDQNEGKNTSLRLKIRDKANNKAFISKQQRFVQKHRNWIPGPGAYIDPLGRSRKLERLRQQRNTTNGHGNHLDGYVSREHQWIFGSDRLTYVNRGSGIGPGAYEVILNTVKRAPDSWSKSDRFNESEWKHNQTALGPGSYYASPTNTGPRLKQMSVFRSRSPKTFVEPLQERVLKEVQVKQHQKDVQLFHPDLLQLEKIARNQQKQPRPKNMDPIFLSKSKRYELINPENGIVGPGSYHFDNKIPAKQSRKKTNSVSNSVRHIKPNNNPNKYVFPGPTDYKLEKYSIEKQVEGKISSLKGNMALEIRFKADWKKDNQASTLPGPGHYNRQKFVSLNEKQYQHRPLVHRYDKVDAPFLSSSERVIQTQKHSPFGTYSLNQYDLAEKYRKKRQHIQKLKAINISVPGFQSSQRRTAFNLGKVMKDHMFKLQSSHHNAESNTNIHKE